jgi:hypothetical protein
MAITRAQQARQMLKKGTKPVEQAGVMNYMPSEMVTVPKVAKSSPTHPTAKLAYITDGCVGDDFATLGTVTISDGM